MRRILLTDRTNLFLVDIPMSRVKFNVNSEYAYLQNFKILQSTLSGRATTRWCGAILTDPE